MILQVLVENLLKSLTGKLQRVRTGIYCASGPTGAEGSSTTPEDPMEPKERGRPAISSSEGRRDCDGDKIVGVGAGEGACAYASGTTGSPTAIAKAHRIRAPCTKFKARTRSMDLYLFFCFVSIE